MSTGSADSGIAAWDAVFGGEHPLPGQVFALEILERPVVFERVAGITTMVVDRVGCREGIYTTRGKGELVKRSIGDDLPSARAADKQAHQFLLGREDGRCEVRHKGLRWASGGVLSVVRWRGQAWTPFFFRDIPPFGWNISLGGSDRGDDLTRPEGFIEREFLEETLVVNGGQVRPFVFAEDGDGTRSLEHAAVHLARRRARDGLVLNGEGDAIAVTPVPTRMRALIRDGEAEHTVTDALVCINRLESAIEVVRALHYEMAEEDYVLDGELLEPAGASGPPDLIRMPVAMISHAYLERAFGREWTDFDHEGTVQASVMGPALRSEEIAMFEPDVIRRRDIRNGSDPTATPFERQRYADWTQRFGRHFYDESDQPSAVDPCRLFTLPAAKIISYYFAHSL